ncbi:hypothetical protein B0T14DRAFT_585014 [Immersiella caudata]|uniref:Zn(2)-C6 fungal-type domain-containing protein n=1 Tax=Immersiella caudata TaxID=314043 RepID=A0AA39WQ18_9PEZI|nr:hypothetical protein B0T14DRAFT_585014 [Immersiella caudata]
MATQPKTMAQFEREFEALEMNRQISDDQHRGLLQDVSARHERKLRVLEKKHTALRAEMLAANGPLDANEYPWAKPYERTDSSFGFTTEGITVKVFTKLQGLVNHSQRDQQVPTNVPIPTSRPAPIGAPISSGRSVPASQPIPISQPTPSRRQIPTIAPISSGQSIPTSQPIPISQPLPRQPPPDVEARPAPEPEPEGSNTQPHGSQIHPLPQGDVILHQEPPPAVAPPIIQSRKRKLISAHTPSTPKRQAKPSITATTRRTRSHSLITNPESNPVGAAPAASTTSQTALDFSLDASGPSAFALPIPAHVVQQSRTPNSPDKVQRTRLGPSNPRCVPCAERNSHCDRKEPCSYCTKRGLQEECHYPWEVRDCAACRVDNVHCSRGRRCDRCEKMGLAECWYGKLIRGVAKRPVTALGMESLRMERVDGGEKVGSAVVGLSGPAVAMRDGKAVEGGSVPTRQLGGEEES